ncbi:hypothetical protein SH2C18_40170 [Clostridium sediminicola]
MDVINIISKEKGYPDINDVKNISYNDGNPNYKTINANEAMKDKNSIFYHYKKLIELRKQNKIIVYGKYALILENHDEIFAYTRELDKEKLLIICNFDKSDVLFTLPNSIKYKKAELLISNYSDSTTSIDEIKLRPYEAIVYSLI